MHIRNVGMCVCKRLRGGQMAVMLYNRIKRGLGKWTTADIRL